MQVVSVDELVTQKILPFDLYNENGERIFSAGEILTPGKLLQLRYISVIYKEDEEESEVTEDDVDLEDLPEDEADYDDQTYIEEEEDSEIADEESEPADEESEFEDEESEFEDEESEFEDEDLIESEIKIVKPETKIKEKPIKSKEIKKDKDKKESRPFEDIINDSSCIRPKIQRDIKAVYVKAVETILENDPETKTKLYLEARDRIVDEIIPMVDEVFYRSQLKMLGPFDQSHGINVTILSTILGYKLKLSNSSIRDVALGAMLHDIGKTKIPQEIFLKQTPSVKDTKLIHLHPQIGYKILIKEMNLPEYIAKVALEHHERNDGSGYPYGISGDSISLLSQIVMVCDVYDTLTSNKGFIKVKNSKEALRAMLEKGSKWFIPDVLYTFIHMSNYNDLSPVEDI